MRAGAAPNFASTPPSSRTESSMVLTRVTRSSTSWAMSLSLVEMTTRRPLSRARSARVPMTSSASTPGTQRRGRPSPRTIRCSGSICARSSSGMGGRFALYAGYHSSRNVFPGASKTTAKYSLGKSARSRRSMLTTPRIAPVGSPSELVNDGIAWKARKR